MEVRKKRTLAGMFIRYICIFCVGTLLLIAILLLVFMGIVNAGLVLPANYAEAELNMNREKIAEADYVDKGMIPEDSTYGVYEASGKYLYGTFVKQDRKNAWECYQENKVFAEGGGNYRFLLKENGEICIVKYYIAAQFSDSFLRKYLPPPVICLMILFVILFVVQSIWISKSFGKKLHKELQVLNKTTECVRRQNLEFEDMHSDIREVEEVLCSLSRMREALQRSLKQQWKLEKRRREQAAALAHDIKTPLTVIKGNAELLDEEGLDGAGKEYNEYILKSAEEIEEYLVVLQDMMLAEEMQEEVISVSCKEMAGKLADRAKVLAESFRIKAEISVQDGYLGGTNNFDKIVCSLGQIQRAWDNIVDNALERTPEHKKIQVVIERVELTEEKYPAGENIGRESSKGEKSYLAAKVLDGGPGFTDEELICAAEQFYQGDKSRHEKKHRGLGLYTASKFAERQGGKVMLEHAGEEGFGGAVTLMLRIER